MSLLDRLPELDKPEYETGRKTIVDVGLRDLVKSHPRSTDVVNLLTDPFLSQEIRGYKDGLEKLSKNLVGQDHTALNLFWRNLYFFPNDLFLRASPDHCDKWLRDSFIGTLNLDQPGIEDNILRGFEDWAIHLPTVMLFPPGSRTWKFNDEVTMLGLIWRAKLLEKGIDLTPSERDHWKERWFVLVKIGVWDGRFMNGAGSEKSWFDAFKFPEADNNSYNQGVYAVATRAAEKLGISEFSSDSAEAIAAYQDMAKDNRLPFSAKLDYKDISSLFGEFLSIALLGENMLSDDVVEETICSHPRKEYGIPIVTQADGSYLSPLEFNSPYPPGDYQNGGEWPVFTAAAQAVAQKHRLKVDLIDPREYVYDLEEQNFPEYYCTSEEAKLLYYGDNHNPKRENHTWNTAVYYAAQVASKA